MTTQQIAHVLKIADVPLARLVEDERNPNHMDAAEFGLLVASIKRAGFLQPVLVRTIDGSDDYAIVDGHHRARAAQEAGLVEVPALVVRTSAEAAAVLQIGMNRIRGELDLGEVARTIVALTEGGWGVADLTLTGFSEEELTNLLSSAQPEGAELEGAIDGPDAAPADTGEGVARPFVLELSFATAAELQACKRGLKRAAGKGRELGEGLLTLLGNGG